MPFQIPVYTVCRAFTQWNLDKYSKILNDFQQDLWLKDSSSPAVETHLTPINIKGHVLAQPPEQYSVSKACISPALSKSKYRAYLQDGTEVKPQKPIEALRFNLIVQGKDAGSK